MAGEFFVGKCFFSYDELIDEINIFQRQNYVSVIKKRTRKITNALKRGSNKTFNNDLVFSELQFMCKQGGSVHSQPLKRHQLFVEKTDCPFTMRFRTTTDGQALELAHFVNEHNHEIKPEDFPYVQLRGSGMYFSVHNRM